MTSQDFENLNYARKFKTFTIIFMGQFDGLLLPFVITHAKKKKDTSGQNRSNVKLFKDDYSNCGFSKKFKEAQYVSPPPNSAQQLRTLTRRIRQRKG